MNKKTIKKFVHNKIKKIKCTCGYFFKKKEFKKHFKRCPYFLDKFTKFDYKISRLIGQYLINKDNLNIVRFLMKRYIKIIDKKIIEYNEEVEKVNEKNNILKYNNTPYDISDIPENENQKTLILDKDKNNGLNMKFITQGENTSNPSEHINIFVDYVNIDIIKSNECIISTQTPTPTSTITPTPGFDSNSYNMKNKINDNINNNQKKSSNNNNYDVNNIINDNNKNDNNIINDNNNSFVDNLLDFGKNYFSLFLNTKQNNNGI